MARDALRDVRLVTRATAVRWFGWGLCEPFIPAFLLLFSSSVAMAGVLVSVYKVSFLVALVLAGLVADRVGSKWLLVAGLVVYPFVGLGYVLAGVSGAVVFVVLARLFNGMAYGCDKVGRHSFFIRHVPQARVARAFGRFDSVTTFWWLVAVSLGLVLVQWVPLWWLFAAIVPGSLVALLIVFRMGRDRVSRSAVRESNWFVLRDGGLRTALGGAAFIGAADAVAYFFIPFISYAGDKSLLEAGLLLVAYSLPALFAVRMGAEVDARRKTMAVLGAAVLVVTGGVLAVSSAYVVLLVGAVAMGVAVELLQLANHAQVARHAPARLCGRACGAADVASEIGGIISALAFGLAVDGLGAGKAFSGFAFVSLLVGAWFAFRLR